jgi:3-oxoacyl-[acyl-carrier-protein] synthase III
VAARVLVIGAEVMTRVIDPEDRATAVLFGDGAGAVVLRAGDADEAGAIGPFDLGSDGSLADLLAIPSGGSRRPIDPQALAERANYLRMEGKEVYRQAVRRMVASSRAVLDVAGLDVASVDRFVGHQANARILEAVADRLGVPGERRITNVHLYGNTSAASIPLALAHGVAEGTLRAGHRVLLTSFGAGFTWGSALMRWPAVALA